MGGIGERTVFSVSVFTLLINFDCCSQRTVCSLACFFLIKINSFSCLWCNFEKFLCSRKYPKVIGTTISAGVFALGNDEAELAPSVVESVFTELLLAPVEVIRESSVGFGAEAVSVSIRLRRIDEVLEVRLLSEEFIADALRHSSAFFIDKGLFS